MARKKVEVPQLEDKMQEERLRRFGPRIQNAVQITIVQTGAASRTHYMQQPRKILTWSWREKAIHSISKRR